MRNVLVTFSLALLAGPALLAGERPYEMVWANRTRDDHPALFPFTDAEGWRVETADAEARLERSQDVLLFGDAVAKLTYRATGKKPSVTLVPPAPIAVTTAFDAVSCWIYGNNHSYRPDPKTPPVNVALNFTDPTGKPFSIYRVRRAAQPPAALLACGRDTVKPGEQVSVRGSAEHTVTIPPDAKPGARLWFTFENDWIDFTVAPAS